MRSGAGSGGGGGGGRRAGAACRPSQLSTPACSTSDMAAPTARVRLAFCAPPAMGVEEGCGVWPNDGVRRASDTGVAGRTGARVAPEGEGT